MGIERKLKKANEISPQQIRSLRESEQSRSAASETEDLKILETRPEDLGILENLEILGGAPEAAELGTLEIRPANFLIFYFF